MNYLKLSYNNRNNCIYPNGHCTIIRGHVFIKSNKRDGLASTHEKIDDKYSTLGPFLKLSRYSHKQY